MCTTLPAPVWQCVNIVVIEVGRCQSCYVGSGVVLHEYCARICVQIWQHKGVNNLLHDTLHKCDIPQTVMT